MTFLEALQSHKGGLIRLKGRLFWYGGRGWDGVHDRICLLMDSVLTYDGAPAVPAARTRYADTDDDGYGDAAACLLIDGHPHWVWIAPADVELL
jgi:hypothetical protein